MDADELCISISALQHYIFCPRQCALIHTERLWSENIYTAEGRILHEKADSSRIDRQSDTLTERSVQIFSKQLRIRGVADVVEYHDDGTVLPIEYKRGKPKQHSADEVQLCAQAICLEEMLGVTISRGALFYGQTRRRHIVEFTESLRQHTASIAQQAYTMINTYTVPMADYSSKCRGCSLIDLCMPKLGNVSARKYLDAIREAPDEEDA